MIELFATAFGGACLGSLITGGVNIWLNKKSYKNDYYKKIIDKRIEACEKVSILLRRFNKIVETNFDSKNVEYFPWITSSKGIDDVCFEIKAAMDQEIWINVDLQDELVAFYNTIEPVIINLKNKGDKEKKESINKEANDWRKKAANITLKLNDELLHLYDVEQFFITNRNQISKRAIDF